MIYDAAIIGGGVAGLQAALTLARANRQVLLLDAGAPRHRFSDRMQNLLGADGLAIGEFYARAHAELAKYPNVKVMRSAVTSAQGSHGEFVLGDALGATHTARKLLFAMGIVDVLPDIKGIGELWGKQVLHCSYCHGYEAVGKTIAAVMTTEGAWMMVESLWHLNATLQFFFEAGHVPDDALQETLRARGIAVELQPITAIARDGTGVALTLGDGRRVQSDVLFVKPRAAPPSILPFQLGCYPVENAYIAVNEWGKTHADGIFAAGDIAGGFQQLATAQASGLRAAVMLNSELTRESLA